jgi:hypothetical protein
MNKKIDFDALNAAMESAPMAEQSTGTNADEMKKKLIQWPVVWEDKIKAGYKGTVNSYILMAIFERMKKDGFIS